MSKRRGPTAIELYLADNEMSIVELARRAGRSWRHVYRVVRGQIPVTVDMAKALHRATDGKLDAAKLLGLKAA